MKNIVIKYLVLLIIGFSLVNCVQSVENPYNGTDTPTTSYTPIIDISKPVSGDSIKMGSTPIIYQALDYADGPGLSLYNLFVNGVLVQTFLQNEDGSNPYLYFNTDTLENKLGINPYSWPSELSYAMTVVNKDGDYGITPATDSTYTVFVNRKPAFLISIVIIN